MSIPSDLLAEADALSRSLATLRFGGLITHVYNPLEYARGPYRVYLERFARAPKRVVFLGMNPGPYGMAQTGVPFGEVTLVRDFLGIDEPVSKPENEHAKRPIVGFNCVRSEVSGARLWGLFRSLCKNPNDFFSWGFTANYCPLVFMEQSGRNVTPDKLSASERAALFTPCDVHLRALVKQLSPDWVVGIGKFAEGRARAALAEHAPPNLRIITMPHPSPANPAANRNWAEQALSQLIAQGLDMRAMIAEARSGDAIAAQR
ncbi:MAG: uracil-DNA glycosylase family protein [Polyangiales bacterium]